MSHENTSLFNVLDIDQAKTRETLKEVYDALEERGYNPVNQIVGYLLSGDPGYISSYKQARTKIQDLERAKIIEVLLLAFKENNK